MALGDFSSWRPQIFIFPVVGSLIALGKTIPNRGWAIVSKLLLPLTSVEFEEL